MIALKVTDRQIGSTFLLVALSCLIVVPAVSRAESVVQIEDLSEHELRSVPFTVIHSGNVHIEAVGGEQNAGAGMFACPWIINADTRALVWSMNDEITEESDESEWLCTFDDRIRFHPGSYVLYYYSGRVSRFFGNINIENFSCKI